jgi:hypothetical protein
MRYTRNEIFPLRPRQQLETQTTMKKAKRKKAILDRFPLTFTTPTTPLQMTVRKKFELSLQGVYMKLLNFSLITMIHSF